MPNSSGKLRGIDDGVLHRKSCRLTLRARPHISLLSFAQAARLHNFVRPTMTESALIDIRDGRHPLQELCVDHFQPNDTQLRAGHEGQEDESPISASRCPSIQVLTGANGCGKSIYLKQAGLICFMAQIGSFVPAQSATIGVVDQILTRIQNQDAVAKGLSSFASDLRQVSRALQGCTRRSLLLLDEVGKGTAAIDGASIFAATLRHLAAKGIECPRTIATTHFHDILRPDILPFDEPLGLLQIFHFEINLAAPLQARGAAAEFDSPLTFLYRLQPGKAHSSHAAHCARACGVPEDVVARAVYVTQLAEKGELSTLQLEALTMEEVGANEGVTAGSSLIARATRAEDRLRRFLELDIAADIRRLEEGVAIASPMARVKEILAHTLDDE